MKTHTLQRKAVRKGFFLGLIITACFLVAVPPLAAQQGQKDYGGQQQQQRNYQYQESAQQQQQPVDFREETLQKFAEAKTAVDEIREEYSKELGNTDDAEKASEIQNKYTQKMIDAVKDKDLSVNKYNDISRAMQSNPEIQKKVNNMMN